MDSLQDIMGKKDFSPPDEVQTLHDYVERRFNSPSSIKVNRDAIILSVPSASLAATLQLERSQIIRTLRLDKKLVIRIGR